MNPNIASERLQGARLVLHEPAAAPQDIRPALSAQSVPHAPPGSAVVRVHAAAVNPSDAKAALGLMPHAVWPRTPGRDFAGTVVSGPAQWVGAQVWGTGGDLGITRDGSHSSFLVLPVEALSAKPSSVSLAAAAAVGVPFITAYEGLRRAGLRGAGQRVLVMGANGKVGQAAVQLAARAGASVIGVDRFNTVYAGHACEPITMLDGRREDFAQAVMDATEGAGADIVYNTVGSPYFEPALQSLAVGGTQVLISTIERTVPLDILAFYRRNLQLVGVDTLKIPATQCASILSSLAQSFDDGRLRAFDVSEDSLLPLEAAADAFRRVLSGSRERVVLAP